jgi:hypothetical protein
VVVGIVVVELLALVVEVECPVVVERVVVVAQDASKSTTSAKVARGARLTAAPLRR